MRRMDCVATGGGGVTLGRRAGRSAFIVGSHKE